MSPESILRCTHRTIEPLDQILFIFNFYYSPLKFRLFLIAFLFAKWKIAKKKLWFETKAEEVENLEKHTLLEVSRPWKIINGTLPVSFTFLFAHFIHIRLWIWQAKPKQKQKQKNAHTATAATNNNQLPGKVHWSKKSSRTQSKSIVGPMDLSTSNIPNIQIKQLR